MNVLQQYTTSLGFTQYEFILIFNFRKMTSQLLEVLLLLSTGHLFGLYNPNQVADALAIPKARLYRVLKALVLGRTGIFI